jgi:hypothetical protein
VLFNDGYGTRMAEFRKLNRSYETYMKLRTEGCSLVGREIHTDRPSSNNEHINMTYWPVKAFHD